MNHTQMSNSARITTKKKSAADGGFRRFSCRYFTVPKKTSQTTIPNLTALTHF